MTEAWSRSCRHEAWLTDSDGLTAGGNALIRSDCYVDMADIILWTCETRRIIHSGSACAGSWATASVTMMLRDDKEPCDTEGSGVGSVYDAIEYVEVGEGETVEW